MRLHLFCPVRFRFPAGTYSHPTPVDVFLGRQPIFGRGLEVFGYELLYRGAPGAESADFEDGDKVTSQVLSTALTEIGLETLVGDRKAFINFTEGFIDGRLAFPTGLPQVVIEVLEDVPVTAEVIRGLQLMREQGHMIALDDFVPASAQMMLLPHADIVKLDYRALDDRRFGELTQVLKDRELQIVAEKLETQDEYEFCREIGVDYFQGYFLAKPKVVHGRSIPTNSLTVMSLLAEFRRPDVQIDDVHRIVSRDVSLAYKLLKHINSSLYGLRYEVASVRDAVCYLGLDRVRNLASLFALSTLGERPVLVEIAMQRARMCELIGERARKPQSDQYFTVGLFSCLEALVGAPLESLLNRLPLADEVTEALITGRGEMGEALACVLAYERGEWERVRHPQLGPRELRDCFLDAMRWAGESLAAERRAA